MRQLLLPVFLFCLCSAGQSQDHGFNYGLASYRELEMTSYPADTSAVALVLDEFGEVYFDNYNDHNLIFEYHARIKVLKQSGVSYGTFEIPLRKSERYEEKILSIRASSYNVENGSLRESKMDPKNVYQENQGKHYDFKKFAIPNVKKGSVIEVFYRLESPFFYNLRSWEFQSEIPKIQSEFWALVPGNYLYNTSLTGFLQLTKNENELVEGCFAPGGGARANCARIKYGIKNIPAFVEEDYMTAKSNFISTVNFELYQINYFDGRKDKITKEWKDVDQELRQHPEFGVQIRRGQDVLDRDLEQILAHETDSLKRAQKIYDFIKGSYSWNGSMGKYSESGIKKAFESKKGNAGDINLSLVAALKYGGINVEPMLLSTRANGLVTDLYPVLSEFNYVVAKVNIGKKVYLLDATDGFLPFGMLPERCLNGKGRVLGNKESYWYDIKPTHREKNVMVLSLALGSDGAVTGAIHHTYLGYSAVSQRKKIRSFNNLQEFMDDFRKNHQDMEITDFVVENMADLEKPLGFKLKIKVDDIFHGDNFLFNPFFLVEQWRRNPFRSSERLYPVDFGAPLEEITILSLEYPDGYEVEGLPGKIGLALPQNGGRYIFEIQNVPRKLSMNNSLLIAKPVFTSGEYHYLKELFNNVIAAQQTELVFKKKK